MADAPAFEPASFEPILLYYIDIYLNIERVIQLIKKRTLMGAFFKWWFDMNDDLMISLIFKEVIF